MLVPRTPRRNPGLRSLFGIVVLFAIAFAARTGKYQIWERGDVGVALLTCAIVASIGLQFLTARRTLVAGFACGVLGLLLVPTRGKVTPGAIQSHCTHRLHSIRLALAVYRTEHGTFPPTFTSDAKGRRVHSWRALIHPYLDPAFGAQYRYDEPWNPHSRRRARHIATHPVWD